MRNNELLTLFSLMCETSEILSDVHLKLDRILGSDVSEGTCPEINSEKGTVIALFGLAERNRLLANDVLKRILDLNDLLGG